jgi:hypothetical protein
MACHVINVVITAEVSAELSKYTESGIDTRAEVQGAPKIPQYQSKLARL